MEHVIIIKIEGELGNSKKTQGIEELNDARSLSMYARFFDECCPAWTTSSEYNLHFLLAQQQHANNLLKARRYLFLNEVYDMLGIPRSKAGQCIGWIYDEQNPVGDNHVDFGIYDRYNSDFVNTRKNTILLDFNVDGMILDRI